MPQILHHKIIGSGPPLVFLHGLFGMLDNWYGFAKELSDRYTCILIDQRNHGRSFHHQDMNYTLMADDVVGVLEQNWIHEAAVMGHSMGGKTAMQLALAHSDLVSHLIVVDIAPVIYTGNHDREFDAMFNLALDQHTSRAALTEALSESLEDTGTVHFILKNIARDPDQKFRWRMGLEQIHENYNELRTAPVPQYGPYEGPTLFVGGGNSPYIRPKHQAEIHRLFPHASTEIIDDAGHWVHVDTPTRLVESIVCFLDS